MYNVLHIISKPNEMDQDQEREETENLKKTIKEIYQNLNQIGRERWKRKKWCEKQQKTHTIIWSKHTNPKVQTFISIWHETARYQSQINQRWFIFANAFECLNVMMEFFSQISLLFFDTPFSSQSKRKKPLQFGFNIRFWMPLHARVQPIFVQIEIHSVWFLLPQFIVILVLFTCLA